MDLKIKTLGWSAGYPIAMLNKKTAEKLGVHIRDRVSVKTISENSKEILAITDISKKMVKEGEVAVSSELIERINLKNGQKVNISLAQAPESLSIIKKKLDGNDLSEKEIKIIIEDVVNNSLSEAEIALFISAMYERGTNMKETIYLIKAILKTGEVLHLKGKFIVDKHSIGGIAGRTSPIVVSICAAAGLIMPKTSSRAITSPAGTADSLETIAKVDFDMKEVAKIVEKTNACLVFGGGLKVVPADSKLIQVEKQLNIDPPAQLLSSIMSKKLAVGSNYIVIDIPYGKTAKVNKKKALGLKKKFEYIGKYFKKKLICLLEENKGPLGNGIGPALEMIDVIKVLKREDNCHLLEKRSLEIAGAIFELVGKSKKGEGIVLAKEILDSGKALDKFKEIIQAQQGHLKKIRQAKFKQDLFSNISGKIIEIDNKNINYTARLSGCPVDKFAGIYLHFNVGNSIKKGEKLLTIYSESKSRLKQAVKYYKSSKPIRVVHNK
jgi:putative thymidine phosphorylase